jgi:hypothetical protein
MHRDSAKRQNSINVNALKLISAEQPSAALAFASTELLHRVAETGPEAVSLLLVHPRNVDGAILRVRLLG